LDIGHFFGNENIMKIITEKQTNTTLKETLKFIYFTILRILEESIFGKEKILEIFKTYILKI
jgi:hypothetical protein